MSNDCARSAVKLENNEIVICNYFYANYLSNDEIMQEIGLEDYIFIPEVPENYIDNKPVGRVDFQVFSFDRFRQRKRYFIIECKRIDGNRDLNCKYIDEGIRRFVGSPHKYTSHYKVNCMLGIIVKDFDVAKNIDDLNYLLANDYRDIHVHTFLTNWSNCANMYVSSHGQDKFERIILLHAFTCRSLYVK